MTNKPIIGCLALQGCVDRHAKHIEAAGADFCAVKTPAQFDEVDAFILPGGESTTMLRLIKVFDLWEPLVKQFAEKPVWGICAGTILMAQKVLVNDNLTSLKEPQNLDGKEQQKSFGLLPMTVIRNGYGTQVTGSHIITINDYDVSFIRAPVIKDVEEGVTIHADYEGEPVWVQKGQYMASTFHPELTFDFPSPMHQMFVDVVKNHEAQKAA